VTGVEPLVEAKVQARTGARHARAAAFARHGSAAAQRLAAIGLEFSGLASHAVVSGFSAIGDEIDPRPLLTTVIADGHRVCLPVMQGKGLPLLFRAWTPGDSTTPGVWGIDEPLTTALRLEPDVLLVPLLAFDATGFRLGYGGGFYDRTIAELRAKKPVIAIGLAFDEQRIDSVPHAAYDQRLDWVLTPSGPVRTT
jgi:5-formyltetrahydrofolate cyclo-ligase